MNEQEKTFDSVMPYSTLTTYAQGKIKSGLDIIFLPYFSEKLLPRKLRNKYS